MSGSLRPDAEVKTGVWECQPGGWQSTREDTEVCYILSGRATITDGDTGTAYEVSAGDVMCSPRAGRAAGT